MSGRRAISTTSRRELSSSFFPLQGKAPKEIDAILTETLACFNPCRAKDLSAPLYSTYKSLSILHDTAAAFQPDHLYVHSGLFMYTRGGAQFNFHSVKWFQQVCHLRTCGGFEWKERWPTYVSLCIHLEKTPTLESQARNMTNKKGDI